MMEQNHNFPPNPRLVDAAESWEIGDELINGVITAAVWSEGRSREFGRR